MSEFEKDHQSIKFKEKGNECYKAKEYDEAIKEYTQSLRVKKSAAAFNNRALVRKSFEVFKISNSSQIPCRSQVEKLHQSHFRCQ